MKKAVFAGSFDPLTLGHCNIIQRSIKLFDKVIVAIGNNSKKQYTYPSHIRKKFIDETFGTQVSTTIYSGLTVELCQSVNACLLIRGIRNVNDLEFEKSIAQLNLELSGIETVFLLTDPKYAHISSSAVKEIQKYNADISKFVPKSVYHHMLNI